jgi:hypothetical protein
MEEDFIGKSLLSTFGKEVEEIVSLFILFLSRNG